MLTLVEGAEPDLVRQVLRDWRLLVSLADAECIAEAACVKLRHRFEARVRDGLTSWCALSHSDVRRLGREVAQRCAITFVFRKRRKWMTVTPPVDWDVPSTDADPSDEAIDRAVHQRLRDLILGEPEERRAFLHLVLIEDCDEAEASRILGVNENTGRSWHARFLKKCRGALRGWDAP